MSKEKIAEIVIGIGILSFISYLILMDIWLIGIIKLMFKSNVY